MANSKLLEKRILHMEIYKDNSSDNLEYVGILSSDAVDRENEIISKAALQKAVDSNQPIVGLIDHKHTVMNQVCTWINKRLETIDGNTALVATPKWFNSNPNTAIIKGILKEGGQIGVSIGAIPKGEPTEIEKDGATYKEWNDLEVLEASFVSIPANQTCHAVAIAKSLGFTVTNNKENTLEEIKMKKKELEDTKEILKEEPEASAEEVKEEVKEESSEVSEKQADNNPKKEDEEEDKKEGKNEPPAKKSYSEEEITKLVETLVEKKIMEYKSAEKGKEPLMKALHSEDTRTNLVSDDPSQLSVSKENEITIENVNKEFKGKMPIYYQ